MIKKNNKLKKPFEPTGNFLFDIAPLYLTAIILMVQFFIFKDFTPHIPLACGIVITGILLKIRGLKWVEMEKHFYHLISVGMPAIMILVGVGMLISSWILAGTVPSILYYGFNLFSPSTFLVSICFICALISLAVGTSWGTVGTIGLAMMGIGEGMGIPAPLTGGAIVSGAFFGDKMSPLSETTNLTAAVCEINLWDHIKNMMPTTVPAILISLAIYAYLGHQFGKTGLDFSKIDLIKQTLQENYHISMLTLLPAIVVIVAALKKLPALPTIYVGTIIGVVIAVFLQNTKIVDIFYMLQYGVQSKTQIDIVDQLLSKGGVMSMTWVVTLSFFALAFVGSLEYFGTLKAIMQKINKWIKSRYGLVLNSYGSVLLIGTVIGDVYTSLILPGRLLKKKYSELGYQRTTLSRSIEDCGTLLSPLIPWNMGGSFVTATLGVSTLLYAPFAFFCWLSPLIGLLWLILNRFIPREQTFRENEGFETDKGEYHETT